LYAAEKMQGNSDMKKIAALILSSIILFSMCACNSGGKGGKAYTSSTATDITNSQIQELIAAAQAQQED
jgi:hypothetical protein